MQTYYSEECPELWTGSLRVRVQWAVRGLDAVPRYGRALKGLRKTGGDNLEDMGSYPRKEEATSPVLSSNPQILTGGVPLRHWTTE